MRNHQHMAENKKKQEDLEPEELEEQEAEALPDRETMFVVSPGDSLGPPDLAP